MADAPERGTFSLKRWSERKHASARAEPPAPAPPSTSPPALPAETTSSSPAIAQAPPALPPVESLTFDDDFTAFMKPDVDPALKRGALKKLFADPRFNVMDGLDTYIDDYSKPDPIDAETVRGLVQARYLFNPPKTRINARGEAEDVPEGEDPEAPQTDAPADPAISSLPAPPPGGDAMPAAPVAGIAADPVAAVELEPAARSEREADR